jgi:hypothetical protein
MDNTDVYGLLTSGETGCPTTFPVTVDAHHFEIKVPKAQIISVAINNREGLVGYDQSYKCLDNGVTGSYAFNDIADHQVTFELLIGARS